MKKVTVEYPMNVAPDRTMKLRSEGWKVRNSLEKQ